MEQFSLGHSYKFNTASFLSIIGLQRKVCLQLPSSALIWIFRLLMHFSTQMFLYSFNNSSILLHNTKKYCIYGRREAILLRLKKKPIFICVRLASCVFPWKGEGSIPQWHLQQGQVGVGREQGSGVRRAAASGTQYIQLHELYWGWWTHRNPNKQEPKLVGQRGEAQTCLCFSAKAVLERLL